MQNFLDQASALLVQYPLLATAVGIVNVMVLAWIADKIAKKVILRTINRLVRETAFEFDDVLREYNVFERLAHLAPAIAIYFGIRLIPGIPEAVDVIVEHAAAAAMVVVGVSAAGGVPYGGREDLFDQQDRGRSTHRGLLSRSRKSPSTSSVEWFSSPRWRVARRWFC